MNKVLKLKPSVKSYIWGGEYFRQFGKGNGEDLLSELWELSLRGDDSSIVDSGEDKGKKLVDVIKDEDIGPVKDSFPFFPILIKLIDARDNLSVQVHPSDDYALSREHSFGKSEMWHIIDCDPGCGVYVGFNKDYTKEEVEKRLRNNTLLDALNFYESKPGDTYIITPGTIHAIGKGVRLIEIQQNSDLTYRLYDYLRKDKFGNYRELHIDKALDVIDYKTYKKPVINSDLLMDCKYFTVKRVNVNNELELNANGDSFISFTFLEGEGNVDDLPYKKFDTFFLPYGKKCVIKGTGVVVISSVRK